ncbi:MAG: TolC family protein, partial [Deltaproteobacteria bacterium]|nr:TolC family protein [Deltaproteobacteria bacterium]
MRRAATPSWLLALTLLWATPARAGELSDLVRDALEHSPELAALNELWHAEAERPGQASALADPTLSIGYQNDGLTSLPYGSSMTTYFSIMGTQSLPFPGKRAARMQLAQAGLPGLRAQAERVKRTLRADIERAWLALGLASDQLALLDLQERTWKDAERAAEARLANGQGSVADVLRTRIEQKRVVQQRLTLKSQAELRRIELNRWAQRPWQQAVAGPATLAALPREVPMAGDVSALTKDLPELALAHAGVDQAERRRALAEIEREPDFAVTAGLMPRGLMEPMWLISFSSTLPIHSGARQNRVVAEAVHQRAAAQRAVESVQQTAVWRARERLAQLQTAAETLYLYSQIIEDDQGALQATLSQYAQGKAPLAAVLQAANAVHADRGSYLGTLVQWHAEAIALREGDLGPTKAIGGGA